MKIVDLQVTPFRVPRRTFQNGTLLPETTVVQTLTRIVTDEGAEGYYFGGFGHGDQDGLQPDEIAALTGHCRGMLLGQDPFDREKIWHWMWVANLPETLLSVIDLALWDLQGRFFGVPVHKLLGGCRNKVKAYASTYPNMGMPEEYAAHALACRAQGYRHYKIHPYYFWDPATRQPDPGRPSHVEWDIEACRQVRAAVGPEMVLSFDPWGTYRTYEEALRVGRELERLNFYWYEHPMSEYRVAAYEKLCRELDIPILSPEIAAGSIYTRADWIRRGASDMSRIDVLRGGITGARKLIAVCEAYGVKCELHMSGFGNLQVLTASSEDTCEYYERGLLAPGVDYETPMPYLETICDPLDADGCVAVPQEPGMGYKQRTIGYLVDHLRGQTRWPDPREKHDNPLLWDYNTPFISAAYLALLDPEHPLLAEKHRSMVRALQAAFASGQYDRGAELRAHAEMAGFASRRFRLCTDKYGLILLSALPDHLPPDLADALVAHVLQNPDGIYYSYPGRLADRPPIGAGRFHSWLNGHQILSRFRAWPQHAAGAIEWIWEQRNAEGLWDFGGQAPRDPYFPLSDSWQSKVKRVVDCSVRVLDLLAQPHPSGRGAEWELLK